MNPQLDPQQEQIRDQQRQTWDRFSPGWKRWDEHVMGWLKPVGDELIRSARLQPDAQLLDIAAGTGEPGLTAAALLPRGKVVVTDLSDRMLEVAAENAARRGIRNFATRQCDVSAMPFAADSFDAITCRFGFMFFPDVDRALAEMVRVARPGARICAAVWGAPAKNAWATTIMSTIQAKVALPAPPPGAPGLFRCAAPGYIDDAFRRAGLRDVVAQEVGGELAFDSPEQYWSFMTEVAAPVVAGLAAADEATREEIRQAVFAQAAKTARDGKVRLEWMAVTVSGGK